MSIRSLLISFFILTAVFLIIFLFSPKIGMRVKYDNAVQTEIVFVSEEATVQNIPDNYVLVAGYDNLYKVINNGSVIQYKKCISNGIYIDYDINIPSNFNLVDEEKNIYEVTDEIGKVINYRQFNGREWDVVDRNGEMIFKIPEGYDRVDNSNEIYYTIDSDMEYWKKLVKLYDGSYAWEVIKKSKKKI